MRVVVSTTLAAFIATAALTVTIAQPSLAEEPASPTYGDGMNAAALFHNGYFIENRTNEKLILKDKTNGGIIQTGGTKCAWTSDKQGQNTHYTDESLTSIPIFPHGPFPKRLCEANGVGFGEGPPEMIPARNENGPGVGYFEIPARVLDGTTRDNTTLVYITSKSKQEVFVNANLELEWHGGVPKNDSFSPLSDHSRCGYSDVQGKNCDFVRSKGRGTQTSFLVLDPPTSE